ncbi:F0F1 ATP synthase subunit epsilon [Rhodocista pekingensis]|uniref:F0F1 ATP synthase subunit epsilon n=1 Tax=Rhodocista pekingensis TaxID=201185 RepID=A0ABW2KSW7_9PROT
MMRLSITTPTAVAVDVAGVVQVRAEDPSGGFGVRTGHADFLTALVPSVVIWRREDGSEGYCAVRGGVLTVSGGHTVAVATREAVPGDDLGRLEHEVRDSFSVREREEQEARSGARKLQVSALRHMLGYLRPDGGGPSRRALREEGAEG